MMIMVHTGEDLLEDDTVGCERPSVRLAPKATGEEGATLILALIFIVVVSVLATALTSWVTSDLKNTSKFTGAQSVESAANSATESALQSVRYAFAASTINASPPSPCLSTGSAITFGEQNTSVTLSVWCSTVYDPLSVHTRTVTISTCLNSVVSAAACASSPLLQAVVVFNDYPANGASECTAADQATCGTGMSIVSWAFGVVTPSVTSVSDSASVSCSPTKLVTINGSGFSGATAVNFLPPGGGDTILSVGPSSVNGSMVTACAPSQLVAETMYQVTVTTPAGTSAADSNSSLTY